ncbi:MAG TPA: NAD-dependent epimerase/dehydratase family protein [Usitatibacter sp.]|nr:NAD-dependent epimerase/dehydratase family protein [Usitatibacter sp.]
MPSQRTILTGASGFVGRALASELAEPFEALALGRPDWVRAIEACDFRDATVFHLAARAHRTAAQTDAVYVHDNLDKTRALAEAAAARGARRFVFMSSIKVNGEETSHVPFRSADPPTPQNAYARSKWAAEQALRELAARTPLSVSIVRSPLVYGAGVKGNLLSLLRLADTPWPLPFAAIANRRSFVHVTDLARLLLDCARLPQAAGRTYLAAHAQPVSTPQLVSRLRLALGRPARLLSMAPRLLEAAAALGAQSEPMRRLTRSLEIDPSPTQRELGWTARIGFEAAVEDMVRGYREGRNP